MLNRKYFPFERNRYYFGKLLTAKDFESEQRYINDKRRFVNRVTGANGVVAGLGVIMADDASIILQAGCAFDASGREVVVGQTQVVKLSTIEGYGQLSTSTAYLGIAYDEQPVDEVYSVMSEENAGVQHNRVRETFKLMLLDENVVAKIASPMDEFIERTVLYSDPDVEVAQLSPKVVVRGSDIAVRTVISRLSPGTGEFSFAYNLNAPGFTSKSGGPGIAVVANNLRLACGESHAIENFFTPEDYIWGAGGSVTMTVSGFAIQKNDENFTVKQNIDVTLRPVESGLTSYYISSYYNKSMDKTLGDTYDERLWIAKINLIRQKNSVIIDSIAPSPYAQYCYNAQQLMMLHQLAGYYPAAGRALPVQAAAMTEAVAKVPAAAEIGDNAKLTACGVFDFPLGLGYAPHQPLFSEEIMHGLGKGPVYVDIGIEYLRADERSTTSEIVLGDATIFADDRLDDEERLYNLDVAVKVLPERGTFVVGVRPNEATDLISLRIRWYAFRLGEVNQKLKPKHEGEKMIMINPDTFVLQPKATAHIKPVFINMPTEACSYKLLDAEGGRVDNNGVYTAPAKEGVYEIRVEALSDPTIYTHAFAIVTQKKKKEKETE